MKNISIARVALFCSFAAPTIALVAPVSSYLPAFYSSISQLSLSQIGFIFLLLKVFDVVSDIAVSVMIDAVPWKKNKYKPWILISIPIMCLGSWLMYLPSPDNINTLYLLLSGFTLYLGFTVASLAHQAWGSELFPSSKELATFFGFREFAVIAGILLVFSVPAVLEGLYSANLTQKVHSAGYLLFILVPLFGMISFFSCPDIKDNKREESSIKSNLASLAILTRKEFVPVVIANLSWFFAISCASALTPFLLLNSLGFGEHIGRFYVSYFVSSLLFSLLWVKLVKNYGELKTLRIAACYTLLISLIIMALYIYPSVILLYVFAVLAGASFAPGPLINRMISAKLAEKLQESSATSVRAKIFSFLVMSEKFGVALGIFIPLSLLDYLGYDPRSQVGDSLSFLAILVYLGGISIGYGFVLAAYKDHGNSFDPNSIGK